MPSLAGLPISAHLETCSDCRARVGKLEENEGRAIEQAEPISMRANALERVMSRLDDAPLAETSGQDFTDQLEGARLPAAAERLGLRRRRYLAPGLWAAQVRGDFLSGWRAFLLRVPRGTTIPTHGHEGREVIAVLSGAFSDGRTYNAGDFVECTRADEHELKVSGDRPCVCLIAIQGRLRWQGWARVITPVLGL